MVSITGATTALHYLSHNVLTIICFVVVGVEIRIFYVIYAKKSRIPSLFRIIIMHILISHIGIAAFGLWHFAVDRVMEVDATIKPRFTQRHLLSNGSSQYEGISSRKYYWHCDAFAIVVFTFWLANCMLDSLHAVIRFNSICRPFHYKKYWTECRLIMLCSTIWAFATTLILIGSFKMHWYFNAIKALVLIFSIITVLLYLSTLAYWKFTKLEHRTSIPQTVIRTTAATFALSSADIIGNIFALNMYFSTPQNLFGQEELEQEYLASRRLWTEIIQVTRQLREILFPILLIALFRKVRCLFLGQCTNRKSKSGNNSSGCVQTRVVDSHTPLINRTSL